jgi:peroxiredoxin Q/BCP
MKRWIGLGLALAGLALTAGQGGAEEAVTPPSVGDPAPNFKLMGSDGKEYTLEQFKGKSAVVMAWYPKAATAG